MCINEGYISSPIKECTKDCSVCQVWRGLVRKN
jgi:hypothetical protein